MVHSVSGWTRGIKLKLWDPLRTRVVPERLTGVFTARRYTNQRLPYLYLTVDAAQEEGDRGILGKGMYMWLIGTAGFRSCRYSWRNTKAPAQLFSLPRDWWREKWSAAYAALGAIRYISQASHYRNCFTFCIGATLQQSYSKKQRVSLRHWLPGRYNFISV